MVTLSFFFLTSVQLVCMRHSSSKEPNMAQQQQTKVRQKYSFILLWDELGLLSNVPQHMSDLIYLSLWWN